MSNLRLEKNIHSIRPYLIISLTVVISILAVWFPFVFRLAPKGTEVYKKGFELVLRMHDGPEYAISAKSLYRADVITTLGTFDPKYFAVHPPGYPLLIRSVAPLFGYLHGMLFINFIAAILLAWSVYYLFHSVMKLDSPLYLTILFFLTPRMLLASSTGSSEVVFLLCTTLAIVLVQRKFFVYAAIVAAYASFTRVPGVLLGVSTILYIFWIGRDGHDKRSLLMVAIASFSGLLIMCMFYLRQYGDLLAYFHSSAVVATGIIYSQFFPGTKHIPDLYLEDILFYFALGWSTLMRAFRKYDWYIYFFVLVNFLFVLSVQHRDISRYILPCMPYLIAMNGKWLSSKAMRWTFVLLAIPAYLYIFKFISNNSYLLSIEAFR